MVDASVHIAELLRVCCRAPFRRADLRTLVAQEAWAETKRWLDKRMGRLPSRVSDAAAGDIVAMSLRVHAGRAPRRWDSCRSVLRCGPLASLCPHLCARATRGHISERSPA